MRKRNRENENESKITVSIEELCSLLSVGKNTAIKVASDAGATIKIGRRTLYSVSKIEAYMDALAAN